MRHPLPLLTREVPALRLRPGATLLLLQDVHDAFVDLADSELAREAARRGVAREFDEYVETIRLVRSHWGRLVRGARDLGIGVVYSCLGHRAGDDPSRFQQMTGWCWCLDQSAGAFDPAWRPEPGEPVFAKPGWGALADGAFERFLRESAIENVIVAGTMLDFGIRQTCYELGDRGWGSLIASDAVVSLTHAAQGPTAGNLAHGLTKLRSTAEILDLLDTVRRQGEVLV